MQRQDAKKQGESKSRTQLCTAASVQLAQLEVDAPDQQFEQNKARAWAKAF